MYNKLETIDNNEILLPPLARYHNEFWTTGSETQCKFVLHFVNIQYLSEMWIDCDYWFPDN